MKNIILVDNILNKKFVIKPKNEIEFFGYLFTLSIITEQNLKDIIKYVKEKINNNSDIIFLINSQNIINYLLGKNYVKH